MSEWRRIKLEELYEVHNGLSKARSFFGSGYPFLSFSTVFNNWFLPESLDSLVQSTAKERESFSIKRGDVFITRTSETPEELGMSSVALKDYPDATFNGFCKRLRQINDAIIPEFAGYVLRSHDFRSRFYGLAGNMTSRASLRNEDLLGMTISLPPLATQRRIASILFNYDSAITNCRRQISLLEEAAMRFYNEWFKDGKREKKTLGDLIVEIESGSRPRGGAVKSGIPSIGAEKIDGIGNYDYTSEKFISRGYFDKMKRGKIQDEDVLLYKDGAYCGKVSMVLDGFPHKEAATNEHVFILRTNRHAAFLYCFLRQSKSFELLNKLACNKAAQPGLNQQDVLGVKIVIPTQAEMESFEGKVMPIMHTIAFFANQIRALTEARDRLLPKLMKGEIAV